jgi:hypothetical protein
LSNYYSVMSHSCGPISNTSTYNREFLSALPFPVPHGVRSGAAGREIASVI